MANTNDRRAIAVGSTTARAKLEAAATDGRLALIDWTLPPRSPSPPFAQAFRITRKLPGTLPPPSPGQADLDAIIAATSVPA